jgi:hypothetical protein
MSVRLGQGMGHCDVEGGVRPWPQTPDRLVSPAGVRGKGRRGFGPGEQRGSGPRATNQQRVVKDTAEAAYTSV